MNRFKFFLLILPAFFIFTQNSFAGAEASGEGTVRLETCDASNLLINPDLNTEEWPYRVAEPDYCIHIYPDGEDIFYYTLPHDARVETGYYNDPDSLNALDTFADGTRVSFQWGITGGDDGTLLITTLVQVKQLYADLIVEDAHYIPDQDGRFELTIKNVGSAPIEDNVSFELGWYNNGEPVVLESDDLFVDELPFLGPGESRMIPYDLSPGVFDESRVLWLLFGPYSLLEDEGIDPEDLQQPELVVKVDPDNTIPESDETNNTGPFIKLYPELELGAVFGPEDIANLQLTVTNRGLSKVTSGILFDLTWLDPEGVPTGDVPQLTFSQKEAVDFEGSGNSSTLVFNSIDSRSVSEFVTQPPANAFFLRVTVQNDDLTDFEEWFSSSDNTQQPEVPAAFLIDNDATLASLTLEPEFGFNFNGEPSYELNVPFTQNSIRVKALANDPRATVSYNGLVPEGEEGVSFALEQGLNVIDIRVMAANEIARRYYSISVTRDPLPTGSSWPSWRRLLLQEEAPVLPAITPPPVFPTPPLPPPFTPVPPAETPVVTPSTPVTTPRTTPPPAVLGEKISRLDELVRSVGPGSSRREIRELQKALKESGYYPSFLETHGYFGGATARGILRYKRAQK